MSVLRPGLEPAGGRWEDRCSARRGTVFDAAPATTLNAGSAELVPAIPNLPPPPRPFVPVLIDSSRGPAPAKLEFERCPQCRRPMPANTEVCPACGTDLNAHDDEDDGRRGPPRRDYEPHRGGVIFALGTASFIFGVIAALALCAGPFAAAD